MRHVGDITKLNGAELPVVDVITGGSPCQDLSIAGARAGLAGERSGLFMEQIRVVKEMRDADKRAGRSGWHVRPRYMVWENVPGAFSSNKGADFGAVLTEIIRIEEPEAGDVLMPDGGWPHSGCILDERGRFSLCWRVHDAQFWGVPQRRKRIALVADFGGLSAPEVLFERSGMRWDPPESGEARQGSSRRVGEGASGAISFQERSGKPGGGKGILIQEEHTGALSTLNNQAVFPLEGNGSRPSHRGDGYGSDSDPSFTLNAVEHHAVAYGISAFDSNAMKSSNPHSGVYEATTSRTLDLNGGSPACNQGGMAVVQVLNDQGGAAMGVSEDVTASLRAEEHGHQPLIFEPGVASRDGGHVYRGVAGTLRSNPGDNLQAIYDVRITSDGTKNARAHCYPTETCRCLDQACDNPDSNHGGVAIVFGKTARPKSKEDAPTYKELDVANTINTFDQGEVRANELVVAIENRPQDSRVKISGDGIVQTLDARMGMGGGNVPMVMERKETEERRVICSDVCGTLAAVDGPKGVSDQYAHEGKLVVQDVKCIGNGQVDQLGLSDKVGALNCMHEQQAVMTYGQSSFGTYTNECATLRAKGGDLGGGSENLAVCNTTVGAICSSDYKGIRNQDIDQDKALVTNNVVRRLTPMECERLQGFPDGWTDIGPWYDSKGKLHKESSDASRYKALGNSIALPFWFYLLRRISAQYERPATLGSLFDGIGGFPLCWERCNGPGTAVWASEIEEFPIAVTKYHFGGE